MKTELSTEQYALRDGVRRLFEAEASPELQRALWTTDTGRNPGVWKGLSEIGIPAILVPEEYGGLGGTEEDLILILEEVGRFVVPDAILEAAFLAPTLLTLAGTEEQKKTWLPQIAEGTVRATVALAGTPYAPDVHVSDIVIVEDDEGYLLLERADFTATAMTSMDIARRIAKVVPLPGAGTRITADDSVRAAVTARQNAGSACVLNGIAQRMLDFSVAYAKVRKQFGRTIGSFQAIKAQLAQATANNVLARAATHAAISKIVTGTGDANDSALLARIVAVEAEFESNRVTFQVHGGIAFTWEHDIQQWLKRGKILEQAHGGGNAHRLTAGRAGVAALA